MVITLSSKGQIVIPAEIRKRLRLREGAKFVARERNGEIILRPVSVDPVEESFGSLAGEPSLVDLLLQERRKELDRENGRFG